MRRTFLGPCFLSACLAALDANAQGATEPGVQVNPTVAVEGHATPGSGASPAPAAPQSTNAPNVAEPHVFDGEAMPLSPRDAVWRALQRSPTLQLAQLSVQSAAEQVRAELGRYPYLLLAEAGLGRSESPQLRADDSVAATVMTTIDSSVGMRRTLPLGTVAEVRASEQYFDRNITQVTVNPFQPATVGHAATLSASVTQPLMRGAGTDIGEVELRAARVSRGVSARALERVESALIRDVLAAYCELWFASEVLEIERQARELARQQQDQAEQRASLGSLSSADLFAFQTRSLELQESVISAELALRQRSLSLSQLIGGVDGEPQTFVATAMPEFSELGLSSEMLFSAMKERSPELAELQEQVRAARVRAEVAGDALRPRLDAQASVQTSGISETMPRAWQRAGGLQWWSAQANLTFELPLDDSRRRAQDAQARLAVSSAESQLRLGHDRIAAEANLASANNSAARARLAGAERTLAVAERSAAAAAARFELGQTIAITLRQAEDDLRRARLRVLRARVDVIQQRLIADHLRDALRPRFTPTTQRASR